MPNIMLKTRGLEWKNSVFNNFFQSLRKIAIEPSTATLDIPKIRKVVIAMSAN